jgi:ssDNA-binding Zn-finger/Zn-ribbon topoisomerase 1
MSQDADFKFESFEEYFGDARQVKKTINECQICGSRLVFTHLSDYRNMFVQETARCPECGGNHKKLIHILN